MTEEGSQVDAGDVINSLKGVIGELHVQIAVAESLNRTLSDDLQKARLEIDSLAEKVK